MNAPCFVCLLTAVTLCMGFFQCIVITEFQAKRMGIWGYPARVAFFVMNKVKKTTNKEKK